MRLFVIPGNPPALYFYELWKQEILEAFPNAQIEISPYPHLGWRQNSHDYLNQVASAHAERFRKFVEREASPVAIVGHSLGAWMALRVFEKSPDAPVAKIFLVHPFLRQPHWRGRGVLAAAYHARPWPFLEIGVLRSRRILEKFFRELPYVTDEELRSALSLARHEKKVLGGHLGAPALPSHSLEKIQVLYAENDIWCPKPTVKMLGESLAIEKVAASHGFITSSLERGEVWRSVLKHLSQ